MKIIQSISCAFAVIGMTVWTQAAEPDAAAWREFRNGGSSNVAGQLPRTWNAESITWQRELAGYGQSSPVIYAGKVFVTSVVGPMKDECLVACIDLKSGKELWATQRPASQKGASNYMAARAAPSPVVDSRAVYAFFESGNCLAVDHTGNVLWQRNLTADYGKFDNNHGLGASPTQTDDMVILNVEHRGPSYLVALSKADGKTQWRTDRTSSSSWSSPVVVNINGKQQIVVSSGGRVDGYEASSGNSLWTIGGLDGNSVPSPTPDALRLLVGARVPEFGSDSQASSSNLCIDLSTLRDSNKSPTVAWRAAKAVSDYASPVVCQDCVYYLNKIGVLHCLNQETGESHYMERLGTQCWATPIVNEDVIYFFGKDGKTQIVRGGPKYELVGSNQLWDPTNPPKPESYTENNQPGGGESGGNGESPSANPNRGRGGGRGAGMLEQLTKADANQDGLLSSEEIPADFKPMLARVDTNGDGSLDEKEIKAMAESFAARRADSREGARDPIVYAAAAVSGAVVIRTGTRLYCVQ